ncbi:MAG: hypothetical protein MZV70_00190 [Desulfobacterales bacterium]|nr:hypothetical protein [Desulfobacterales bacterium]
MKQRSRNFSTSNGCSMSWPASRHSAGFGTEVAARGGAAVPGGPAWSRRASATAFSPAG